MRWMGINHIQRRDVPIEPKIFGRKPANKKEQREGTNKRNSILSLANDSKN